MENNRSIIVVLGLVAGLFMWTSCAKTWNCSCEVGTGGGVANTGSSATYTTTIKNKKKTDAQNKCDELGKQYVTNGTYVCHID
jgi:hypothetical protein